VWFRRRSYWRLKSSPWNLPAWTSRDRPRRRNITGGTDAEINSMILAGWNSCLDYRKKKTTRPCISWANQGSTKVPRSSKLWKNREFSIGRYLPKNTENVKIRQFTIIPRNFCTALEQTYDRTRWRWLLGPECYRLTLIRDGSDRPGAAHRADAPCGWCSERRYHLDHVCRKYSLWQLKRVTPGRPFLRTFNDLTRFRHDALYYSHCKTYCKIKGILS